MSKCDNTPTVIFNSPISQSHFVHYNTPRALGFCSNGLITQFLELVHFRLVSKVKLQGCGCTFVRPGSLPVGQPVVSKHWRMVVFFAFWLNVRGLLRHPNFGNSPKELLRSISSWNCEYKIQMLYFHSTSQEIQKLATYACIVLQWLTS